MATHRLIDFVVIYVGTSLCICACVCVYLCVQKSVYMCIYLCKSLCICVRVYLSVLVRLYVSMQQPTRKISQHMNDHRYFSKHFSLFFITYEHTVINDLLDIFYFRIFSLTRPANWQKLTLVCPNSASFLSFDIRFKESGPVRALNCHYPLQYACFDISY